MKSNERVPRGSGSKVSWKEASPDLGIQKSESASMPCVPVRA